VTGIASSCTSTPTELAHAALPELSVGWVDPWVGLGRDFSVFGGLGWVHYSKSTKKICKDYFNAFKARSDNIWLHQAVKFDFMADLTGTGN